MTTAQCSKEHVTACLARLQSTVKTSFRSEDAAKLTFSAYIDELTRFSPQAVTAGCLQWARQKPTWPSLAELLSFISGNDVNRALPNPNAPENLLARIKRVTGRDAFWTRDHHDVLMAEVFPDHCEGVLSDEELSHRVNAIADGRTVYRERPQISDDKLLAAWRQNDRMAEEISDNPPAYLCAQALIAAHANFRARRDRERPDLAARYYGETA